MVNYEGHLLRDESISPGLRERLDSLIESLSCFESLSPPVIPYLAAWDEGRRVIWYEFMGRRLCDLLDCDTRQAAMAFRHAVVDHRIYRYDSGDSGEVEEEITTRDELGDQRHGIREKVKRSGNVEAVYKVAAGESFFWFKDQAKIENFKADNVCLSVGFLTDVTKEMEQKDFFEKIGYFDELTGLPKRLIMERIFEVNMGNYKRAHVEDFVFMMVDVDHFKAVNDTHGHQAGDYILASLAELMVSSKRKEDEIGRYGGEEFYCFSVGSVKNGVDFAERLRCKIEAYDFVYEGKKIPITVSIGVCAASQLDETDNLLLESLIKTADEMLYDAKNKGRNQVVLFSS